MINQNAGNAQKERSFIKKWRVIALFTVLLIPAIAQSGDADDSRKKLDELNIRLTWIRGELELAQFDVGKKEHEYFNVEHDIVYANKDLNKIYMAVRAAEKDLLEKRKVLQEEIMKSPEMRKVTKERMAAFENRKKLYDQESVVLGEIKAEEKKASSGAKPDEKQKK